MRPCRAHRNLLIQLVCITTIWCTALPAAFANGLIIAPVDQPPPGGIVDRPEIPRHPPQRPIERWMPFVIRSQSVNVEISEALAETTLEQVFINRSGAPQEGQYLFPIAEEAGVRDFSMWMNGKEVRGELLDADRARAIYESIVAKARDPGLLQFAGRGLIQARVFPIPAGGECRIRLRYSEPIKIDGGLASYRFPLGSSGCRFDPIEQFSIRAVVKTERPLISIFSTTHECSIDRHGEREAVVGLEKQRLSPESDFVLLAQLGTDAFGFSLLPYRPDGEEGFFMARITPRISAKEDAVQPKNICFVLDTSGSMADSNKIEQAKKSLQFCVTNLNPADHFNVITFATDVRPFRDAWSTADGASKAAAREFIDRLNAVGGTDINAALGRALQMNPSLSAPQGDAWRKNPYFIVFITDGEPTVGVTNPDEILKAVGAGNQNQYARIFSLGVGFQVNTKLLDRLSDDNGGARDYVTPTENLELKMSAFYTKLANPVLSDIRIAFDGVSIHDSYPRIQSDLFEGGELVMVGRYSGATGSAQRVTLSGVCRGEKRTYEYSCVFPSLDTRHDFLPRFWAMRKIGFLLDELRLHGVNDELKNEVIRLSKQYGILTPYTSYLVQEDEQIARRRGRSAIGGQFLPAPMSAAMDEKKDHYSEAAAGQRESVGAAATKQTQGNRLMRRMDCDDANEDFVRLQAENCDSEGRALVNFVGARTFYFDGSRWVDARYDGKSATKRLVLFTPEYYDALRRHRELGPCFAQGSRVIVVCGQELIETVSATAEPSATSDVPTQP